jgi:hypothetical protein
MRIEGKRGNALDEVEVEVLEAELLEGVVESSLDEFRLVLRVPELRLQRTMCDQYRDLHDEKRDRENAR